MLASNFFSLLASAFLVTGAPITSGVKLDPTATAEAQQRDSTATRAFIATQIKVNFSCSPFYINNIEVGFLQQTFDGQCLFVDPTSGDFRENLTPIQTKPCDASAGQKWDIITAGKHNDKSGFALIVSSQVLSFTKLLPDLHSERDLQTSACLNFDPRRRVGNQVLLFSCGGRADGSGAVTDSQLFPFNDGQTSLSFRPKNGNNVTCLAPINGLLDQTSCSEAVNQVIILAFLKIRSSA